MVPLDLTDLIFQLSQPDAYPHPVETVEVHQTHISVVFLAGPFAYKVKKPVNLGFLDFSTLEMRKHFCEEEVRLNRRLAPQVYLGVIPILGQPEAQATVSDGIPRLRFGVKDNGSAIEWAVQMKRLPAEATLEQRLLRGEVTPYQMQMLAERLATFHRRAESGPRISSFGRFAVVAHNARENFTQADQLVGATVSPIVFERLRGLTESYLERLRDVIERRAERNVPRDTHGDLHLDHVYVFPEESPPNDLVMIDCIEFSDRFRFADPVADMAFLVMDLEFHGRRDLARVFVDAYFEASEDRQGADLLSFYAAYRSVVRAKVEGMELCEYEIDPAERASAMARARAHWLLALGRLEEPRNRPVLVLVGGLPGTGKSTLARSLAAAANFEVVRSDVVRKELTSTPLDSVREGMGVRGGSQANNNYSPEWTERTYGELLVRCEELLWQGRRVLVDANYREDSWRRRFLDAARRWCVPIVFVECQATSEVVRRRLDLRRNDVSDADWHVYQQLESTWQPLSDDVRGVTLKLDTSGTAGGSQEVLMARLAAEGLI